MIACDIQIKYLKALACTLKSCEIYVTCNRFSTIVYSLPCFYNILRLEDAKMVIYVKSSSVNHLRALLWNHMKSSLSYNYITHFDNWNVYAKRTSVQAESLRWIMDRLPQSQWACCFWWNAAKERCPGRATPAVSDNVYRCTEIPTYLPVRCLLT